MWRMAMESTALLLRSMGACRANTSCADAFCTASVHSAVNVNVLNMFFNVIIRCLVIKLFVWGDAPFRVPEVVR